MQHLTLEGNGAPWPPFWLRCVARWPWLRPRRCWWRSRGDACGADVERENVTFFLLRTLVHFFGLKFLGNHPFGLRTCHFCEFFGRRMIEKGQICAQGKAVKILTLGPCLAPYRNSCREISPSPSSIMLNLKKFRVRVSCTFLGLMAHSLGWWSLLDSQRRSWIIRKTSSAKRDRFFSIFKVAENILVTASNGKNAENPPIFTSETRRKSWSKLPRKKNSMFNGLTNHQKSSTQCPTDSPNHDSRAPKWPTNFAALGCSIRHWTLSKSKHLRDLVA